MFTEIKKQMQAKFAEMSSLGTLYYVEVDRDEIWDIYLNAIPERYKQGNSCNCCKSFLRQYGSIVGIKNNLIVTLWDFLTEDEEYKDAIKALRDYIVSKPIKNIFLNTFAKCGVDKNPDPVNKVIWEHFYLHLPAAYVKPEIGPIQANALGNKEVLERSLNELTDSAVETVLELINQNSLYKGSEFKNMVVEFQKIKERYKKVKGATPKSNFCWVESAKATPAVTRIKNSAIGTLLVDLSEGRELDSAVSAYERVVAPTNYKRSTAITTPRMIDDAKKKLEELGLSNSIYRRMLSDKDLTVNNTLFVHRLSNIGGDIFDEMKKDNVVNPKSLSKVEEVSIEDFIKKVAPTAKSIKVFVENRHFGNFCSLVGPKFDDTPTLFKWGNSLSWNYTGQLADSMKEKVKAAGGKVEGFLRVSLAWANGDDLDLHLEEPNGNRVYYGRKTGYSGVNLDVDMNAGYATNSKDPVENMIWVNPPTVDGIYKVIVNNFSARQANNQGFEVELENNYGEIFSWSKDNNKVLSENIFKFKYTKKNGVEILTESNGSSAKQYNSKEKWGIKSGSFHQLKSLSLSPNHWGEKGIGNKHYMFFLQDCKTTDPVRGFYNEFLKEELMANRKVFEVLASKISVDPTENELSGLGFSETIRNDLVVEVTGSFRRLLRIKF